jgi:hypothetical protein
VRRREMLNVLKGATAWKPQRQTSPMEPVDDVSGDQPQFLAQALAWVDYRRITLESLRRELTACAAEETAAAGSGGKAGVTL